MTSERFEQAIRTILEKVRRIEGNTGAIGNRVCMGDANSQEEIKKALTYYSDEGTSGHPLSEKEFDGDVIGEGWIAVPIEGNAYEAGLAMKGYNQAKREIRVTLTEKEHELLIVCLAKYLLYLSDADDFREIVSLVGKIWSGRSTTTAE